MALKEIVDEYNMADLIANLMQTAAAYNTGRPEYWIRTVRKVSEPFLQEWPKTTPHPNWWTEEQASAAITAYILMCTSYNWHTAEGVSDLGNLITTYMTKQASKYKPLPGSVWGEAREYMDRTGREA